MFSLSCGNLTYNIKLQLAILIEPKPFISSLNPFHSTTYVYLHPGASLTILFCPGAGSPVVCLNRLAPFTAKNPSVSILTVQRWTQGPSCSRSAPKLLEELTSITRELLTHLNIQKLDAVVCHSAGIYQLLHFSITYPAMVGRVFPISPHIPNRWTDSRVMNAMCTMPEAVFRVIAAVDCADLGPWANKLTGTGRIGDNFICDKQIMEEIRNYMGKPSAEDRRRQKETIDVDYKLGYGRVDGAGVMVLEEMFVEHPQVVGMTWITCRGDIFFGPESVDRARRDMTAGSAIEVLLVEGAVHGDIWQRWFVWDEILKRILK